MATIVGNLRRVMTRATTLAFYRRSVWAGIFDRRFDGLAQMSYKITVDDLDDKIKSDSRTRAEVNSAFIANPVDAVITQKTLEMNNHQEAVFQVTDLDRLETPSGPELWARGIRRLGLRLAQDVDKDLGVDIPATVIAADQTLDAVGAAGSRFITPGGVATTPANGVPATRMVRELIDAASLHYVENDLDMGEIEGANISPFFAVVPYKLINILKNDMIDSGYQDEGLAARAAWMNSILGTQAYAGRLFGIDVFGTNSIPQASANAAWKIWFGCRQAIDVAIRAMRMNINLAATRDTGGWVDTYRVRCDYGFMVTNPQLWLVGSIHQK